MNKVSIIVPIYNKEEHLERCIESILNQTFKNFELILINDGSKDNSLSICKYYKSIDNRIIIIDQKNKGVSAARNVGIDNSSGEYLMFIDSDDYLELDYIEYLINLIYLYNAEISCCKMKTLKNGCIYVSKNNKFNEKIEVYSKIDAINRYSENGIFLYSSCNKLYKKELFGNNIRFSEEINYAEDALINYYLLDKASRIVMSNLPKYNYFINEGSTVMKVDVKRIDVLKAQKNMYLFLKNKYKNCLNYIINDYVNSSILLVADISKEFDLNKLHILNLLKNQINKDIDVIKNLNSISYKNRILFNIIRINPIILLIVYKLKDKLYKLNRRIWGKV